MMCMILSLSEQYGREYFVKSDDAKWWQALLIRLMSPFYLFKILQNTIFLKQDDNFITKTYNNELTGRLRVASSEQLDFRLIKALQKTINVTINDIITTAVSKAMK
jgi:hypothetical protein